jgi:osmotically-inducible protein OsmY
MEKSNDVLSKEVIKLEPILHADNKDGNTKDDIAVHNVKSDIHMQKNATGEAPKSIMGVESISDVLKVKPSLLVRNDKDIATSVSKALHEKWNVPDKKINVTVEDGLVTLQGNLHWNFQRKAADGAIENLEGVKGIQDKIKIEAEIKNELGKKILEQALKRSWIMDIDNIKVRMDDKTIFLSGIVNSVFQKQEAEKIAFNTTGAWFVENELQVEFD